MVCRGGQSPSSPKGLTRHTAQDIDYGSRQCTCMPQVILFLQKIISGKELWEAYYISDRVCPGGCQGCPAVEEAYPKKTCNVDGVLKTTVHHWIVGSTICVHCNSLKPVWTEENKVARLLMVLHFRTCLIGSIWMRSGFSSPGRRRGLSFSQRRKTQNAASNTNPT